MKAMYKCRLCGEVFHNGATTGKEIAEVCMVEMNAGIYSGSMPLAPRMTETHSCGGDHAGSLGLADFQGWKKEPAMDMGEKTDKG